MYWKHNDLDIFGTLLSADTGLFLVNEESDVFNVLLFFLDPKSIDNTDFHSMFLSSASIM